MGLSKTGHHRVSFIIFCLWQWMSKGRIWCLGFWCLWHTRLLSFGHASKTVGPAKLPMSIATSILRNQGRIRRPLTLSSTHGGTEFWEPQVVVNIQGFLVACIPYSLGVNMHLVPLIGQFSAFILPSSQLENRDLKHGWYPILLSTMMTNPEVFGILFSNPSGSIETSKLEFYGFDSTTQQWPFDFQYVCSNFSQFLGRFHHPTLVILEYTHIYIIYTYIII